MFVAASAAGHGGEDDSAVIKAYAALTGITLPAPPSTVSPAGGRGDVQHSPTTR
jgi:hypothetical protein